MRFSDFLLVSDPSDLDFIVGYTEEQNIRISVSDIFGGYIKGSGNAGYVPVFTSNDSIGNSQIFQDGSNIVIGGVNAMGYRLAVGGTIYAFNGAVIETTALGADALRVISEGENIFVIPNDLGQSITSSRRIIHPPAVLTTESATLGQLNAAISNLDAEIDILLALKVDKTSVGVANGVASLDAGGKVPLSQIPDSIIGQVQYMGTWNALTNTPTLNFLVPEEKGHYYVVSVAGVFGGIDFQVGDWIISNGTYWEKVDNTDAVTSVFGRIGAILPLEADYQSFYPRLSQAYDNPTWINSLAFTKITGVPPFLLENQTITLSGDVTGSGKTSIPTTISNNAVSNEKLRDSVGTSVIGRSVFSTGDPADIQANSDGHVLLRSAGNLLFGLISSDSISSINWSKITGTPTTLSGYGITDAYTKTEADNKFVPYTGASANVNLGSNNINANSFIKVGGTSSQFLKADGSVDASQYVPTTRSINAGTGLTGGGNLSSDVNISFDTTWGDIRYAYRTRQLTINGTTYDLSADRTWNVGTVTSVGLSMPSAFTVSNSPVNGSGTLTVVGAGTASQYVRGDGTLGDFPGGGGGGGSSVSYYLNSSVSQGTIGGVAYRELSKVPILGAGTDISINADGYIASYITDAGDPNLLEIPAGNWNFETYFSASSGGGTPTFYVELYKVNAGGTATLIASNSATPELIAFGTTINAYFSSLAVPTTTLTITDRLALRYYVNHSGRIITLHTEDNHLCQVITTFTTGLTALNGLTSQVQYFQVGTSGTDFNIASSVDTHTFNLPTASATNRGALSAADWSTFNAKMPAITFNSPLFIASGGQVGITQAGTSSNGFLSSTDWNTFNNKENAITAGTTAQYFRGDKTFQTLNTSVVPEGTNLYYTEARVNANTNVAANTAARHNAVTLGTANGLSLSTQVLSLGLASAGVTGALSGTDWSTFNNKQNALTNPVTGTGTTNYLPKFTGSTTIGNSQVFDNGTNVGIGTISPLTNLTVRGSATNIMSLQYSNDGGGVGYGIYNVAGTELFSIGGGRFVRQDELAISRQGTSVIYINNSNNVGIGTTSPSDILHLFKSTYPIFRIQSTSYNSSVGIDTANGTLVLNNESNAALGFNTNNTERMRITSTGEVGIGSVFAYLDRLSVLGSSRFYDTAYRYLRVGMVSGNAILNADWFSGGGGSAPNMVFQTASTERMRITPGGNVLVGTTTDVGNKLYVSGSIKATTGFAFPAFAGISEWQIGSDAVTGTGLYLYNSGVGYSMILSAAGAATFLSSVTATRFNLASGSFSNSGFWGSIITAGSGTYSNFAILDSATNGLMWNPTGTLNMAFGGSGTFASSVTGSGLNAKGTTLNNSNAIRLLRADNTEMGYIGWSNENTNNSTWLFKSSNGNPIAFSPDGINQEVIFNTDGSAFFNYPIISSRSFVFRTVSGRPLTLETLSLGGVHSLYLRPNDSGRNLISSNYYSGGVYLPLALSGRENDSDLVLSTSGNVLIGTTTDVGARLYINGTGRFNGTLGVTSGLSIFKSDASTTGGIVAYDSAINQFYLWNNISSGYFSIYTNSAERFTITSGGNVGIGTASPQKPLESISNANDFVSVGVAPLGVGQWAGIHFGYRESNTAYRKSAIVFQRTDLTANDAQGKIHILNGPQGGAGSATLADAKLTIAENGNVGIGTTSPNQSMHSVNGFYATNRTLPNNTNISGIQIGYDTTDNIGIINTWNSRPLRIDAFNDISFRASGTDRVTIKSGGNVLIGTTTDAGYTLNVAGNAQIVRSGTSTALVAGLSGVTGSIIRFSYNGGFVGSISTDGSNTAYNTSSDYRLKEQVRAIDNPLEKVLKLNPVNFKYKNSKTVQDGFIAHEIQEILPYLVTGEKDGEQMQEVDYSKLTPILIAAIKEQQAQIQELKNKLS